MAFHACPALRSTQASVTENFEINAASVNASVHVVQLSREEKRMTKLDPKIAAALLSFDTFDPDRMHLVVDFDPGTLRTLQALGYVSQGRRWVRLTELGYSARARAEKQQGK